MRTILFLSLMAPTFMSNATGTFSKLEVNPKQGTEEYFWSDSNKHIYGAGELTNFAELNGNLYFTAQDTIGNEELWMTDGTQQGTSLVKDINPDGSSMIGYMITAGNKLF